MRVGMSWCRIAAGAGSSRSDQRVRADRAGRLRVAGRGGLAFPLVLELAGERTVQQRARAAVCRRCGQARHGERVPAEHPTGWLAGRLTRRIGSGTRTAARQRGGHGGGQARAHSAAGSLSRDQDARSDPGGRRGRRGKPDHVFAAAGRGPAQCADRGSARCGSPAARGVAGEFPQAARLGEIAAIAPSGRMQLACS